MKHWYDYDITELNESMFEDIDEACGETCGETSGFESGDEGDAPDTEIDTTDDGFDTPEDSSGFAEGAEEDGFIKSGYHDDEVDPNTIPQNKAEDDAYKNDPVKVDTTEIMRKDNDGTEEINMESFFDDVDFDLF